MADPTTLLLLLLPLAAWIAYSSASTALLPSLALAAVVAAVALSGST